MGKQEIIQVLLVDGSVVVVFLDEEATASNLIQSVVDEISLDKNKSNNYFGWIGILLSPDSHSKYQEVLGDTIEGLSNNRETRILEENEKVFDKINVRLEEEKIKSSKSTTDIHEFSQHLHQVCFKVVNSYDQITFSIKDVKGFTDGVSKSIYISPSYSVKELIDIVTDGLGLNNNLEDTKKGAPNTQLYTLSIVKTDNDESFSTENLSDDLNVLEIFLDFKNKTLIKEIKKFELVFSNNEGWYKKMGTLTSRFTMNLSRPLSVLNFIGEGMSKTSYSSPNAKTNSKTTSPFKPIRHLSLSATESEFEVDPSRITTWISGEAGKPRRQTILDPVFDPEWSATYPIFRKLRHRERLGSMIEEEEKDSTLIDDFIDPDKLEEELTELDQAFNRVLDDLNIKDGVRAKMLQFPPSKKIELIEQNEAVQRAKNSATPLSPNASEPNFIRPKSVASPAILPSVEDSARSAAQTSLENLLSSDKGTSKNPTTLTGYLFGNLFSSNSVNHPEGSVEYYLSQLSSRGLQAQDIFKCLQSLRITLSSASVSWIRNFLDGGSAIQSLEFLLEKFISKHDSIANEVPGSKVHDIDEEVQLECIRCFRILLNTEPGFHEVLKHPSLIQSLAFSINTTNDKIRNIVAELLAAICVLSIDGHSQVLDALSDFRLKFHEEHRFQYILDSLHAPVSTEGISAIAAYEYKTTCLSFINALVNSPESLDERMLLREEFRRRGLLHIFQDLRESYPPESLSKQIECYEEETSADISELKDNVMFETLEAENTNLIDFAENMRQMNKESVLNDVVNEIIASLNDLLNCELDDEIRYEIMNTTSRFFIQAIKFKDTEDWSLVLDSFFQESKDLIALDIREFFESQPQFKSELQKLEEFKSNCIVLEEKLELAQKELSDIKNTPMISYILNQDLNDTDEFNLIKSPKDNFTTLIQRLVLKEKEISSLREKIEILEKLKVSEGSESKVLENSWSAIKEELDAKKQENNELNNTVEARGKEIAYLKRSLEAVCTRFQLAVKEFSPDENIDVLSNSMTIDSSAIISLPEVQKIQLELEKAQNDLENKDDLESELTSYKNKVSMLNLQIQEQNIKLAEKDSELQNLQKKLNNSVEPAPSHSSFVKTRMSDNYLNTTKTSHTPSKSLSSIPPNSLTDPSSFNKAHDGETSIGDSINKKASDNEKSKSQSILSSQFVPPPPPPPPPPRMTVPLAVIPLPPPPPPPLPSNAPKKSWTVSAPPMPPPPPPIHGSAAAKGSNLLDPNSSQCILASPSSLIGESITSISDILKPKVPMKSFFWKKIPTSKIPTTFWSHPQEEDILSKLNLEDIEALFQKKIAKKPGSGYTSIGRKIKEKKNITLIEFNRANNIAITLARMKMPFSAIKLAILEVNDSRLSIDNLRSLENHAPTQEEVNLVRTFTGSFDSLGTAEKYILQIMDIPRLSERLNCMIFRRRFENDIEEIRPELNVLNKAVVELKSSKRLVLLLEIILTVGNFLNANTPRGDAKGFKLEALRQLKDLKANSKGHDLHVVSLLHYFAWISEESWENLTDLKKDFPSIESAARISVTTLTNNVYSLVQGVKQIQLELRAHKKLMSLSENDKFIGTMENFVNIASKVSASIKESSDKLENNLEELLTYFGEDSTITKPEDFFNLIISFLDALEIARAENSKLKEKAMQKTMNVSKKPADPVPGFGRGDFDVAVRELRSGLRRKRTERERPRSQLFSNLNSLPISSLDSSPKP